MKFILLLQILLHSFSKTSLDRVHIFYDSGFTEDISFLINSSYQSRHNVDVQFHRSENLNDIIEPVVREDDLVFSFTKQINAFDAIFTNRHYGFGRSFSDIERNYHRESEQLCLQRTFYLKQTLFSLVLSLSVSGVAIIGDGSACSKMFLSSLKELFKRSQNLNGIELNIIAIEFDFESKNETMLTETFYNLKTIEIPVLILLLSKDYYITVFKQANRFSLIGPNHLWLIPNYDVKYETFSTPKEILTFGKFDSRDNTRYSSIQVAIPILVRKYPSYVNKCASSVSMHQSCVKLLLHEELRMMEEATISEFELDVRYKRADNDWLSVKAKIDSAKFEIEGKDIKILRSFIGLGERRRITAVTIRDEPFVMDDYSLYKKDVRACLEGIKCGRYVDDNSRVVFQQTCCVGYLIDILQLLITDLNLDVHMYFVEDGKYGAIKNGRWNGLVGDLLEKKAEIAIASLTITKGRSSVIDFTVPLTLGSVGILLQTQVGKPPFLNSEFLPMTLAFQLSLWFFFSASILFNYLFENNVFFASLFDKKGRKTKYYSMCESISYIGGIFVQKDIGGGVPTRIGAQFSAILVSFGMVIVITTFTAVLAARSVQKREKDPFYGSKDERMINPTDNFRFGVLRDSSYETFFSRGETDILRRMFKFMRKYNYNTTTEGIEMLKNGTLNAIITDYLQAYHYLSNKKSCDLRLVGDNIIQTGLALALTKNNELKSQLDRAIFRYAEQEKIANLQKKWFKSLCVPTEFATEKTRLSVNWFGGLIMLLLCGALLSVFLLFLEHLYYLYFRSCIVEYANKFIKRYRKEEIKS